jgi:Tfp pilus assembly protein PilO
MSIVKEYQRPLLVAVVGIVAAILLYALLISPQSSKLSNLNAQKTQLVGQQQQLQSTLTTLQSEKHTLPAKCAVLQKISVQIPSVQNPGDLAAEQSSFYNQLTALVGSSGTSIPSFAWTGNTASAATATTPPVAGSPTVSSGVVPIPVKMHITGNYAQMSAFIAGLDSFPRLFVIQTFTLAVGAGAATSTAGASTGGSAAAGATAPPLWVGQTPTAPTGGPYGLDVAGSIYYTATPSALAACTQAANAK